MAFVYNGILPLSYQVKPAIIAESAFSKPDDLGDMAWNQVLAAALKAQTPENFSPQMKIPQ